MEVGMDATVFRDTIVKPALVGLDQWSEWAEKLIMGTAAQESHLISTRQVDSGPALGYFQMEPATYDDCWTNYIDFRAALKAKVLAVRAAPGTHQAADLETNPKHAAAMARVRYMRVLESIPTDGQGIARYWKTYYNTPLGAGTVADFIANWNRYLAPSLYPPIN
jgi:hypothetical protein